jgi:hypothetical protein
VSGCGFTVSSIMRIMALSQEKFIYACVDEAARW